MKTSQDTIVLAITNVIGVCAMIFGMSSDVTSAIQSAVPTVVGGVMSIVSVVTYLINRRKGKEAVLMAVANAMAVNPTGSQEKDEIVKTARSIGLI